MSSLPQLLPARSPRPLCSEVGLWRGKGNNQPWMGIKPGCSGLTLARCQVPTKATLSLPLLNWTGEKKYNERLVGRDKDREITSPITVTGKTDSTWGKLV